MIPNQPSQSPPIRAKPRRRAKIRPLKQRNLPPTPNIHPHNRIHRLAIISHPPLRGGIKGGVSLPHADNPPPRRVIHPIGIPQRPLRRNRPRRPAPFLPVNPLIRKIDEKHHPVLHQKRPAPILMHPRPHAIRRRRNINRHPIPAPPHHHHPPPLRRPHFHPIHLIPIQRNLPQPHRPARNQIRGNRRFPRPIRRNNNHPSNLQSNHQHYTTPHPALGLFKTRNGPKCVADFVIS